MIARASSLLAPCSLPSRSARDVQVTKVIEDEEEVEEITEDLSENVAYGPPAHPCFNTTVNHTVTTPEGEKVLCLVPSEDDLMKKIEGIGGYNRHYSAVTEEEVAEFFENPFKPIDSNKSEAILEWSSNYTGKRRRSIEEDGYNSGSEEGHDHGRVKRGVSIIGLQTCERKGTRSSLGFSQLCTECWWIKKLPDGKFPRYINERICGENGNSDSIYGDMCNGSDGLCLQRSITQDLLVQTNQYVKIQSPDPQYSVVYKQVWNTYGQKIRSCCQCQNS